MPGEREGLHSRCARVPTGGSLEQADGTAWMAFFSQCMLQIAIELAQHDEVYGDMALKFLEHFLRIGAAMNRPTADGQEMWDEEDGFYYDVLRLPDGSAQRLKVRSMVGLLPLCASTVVSAAAVQKLPRLLERSRWFIARHRDLADRVAPLTPGANGRILFSLLDETKLRRVLARVLDESEFLSPAGIRSMSKAHLENPYIYRLGDAEYRVAYQPGESDTAMFGGNSNWRGPVWMPINLLLVRAIFNLYAYYGDEFKIECPTGSGNMMTLYEVGKDLARRMVSPFERNAQGQRPVFGNSDLLQQNPHWRDHLLFYEFFHGDTGAGLGASHQTGWTGVVAKLVDVLETFTAKGILEGRVR